VASRAHSRHDETDNKDHNTFHSFDDETERRLHIPTMQKKLNILTTTHFRHVETDYFDHDTF
jgi:hypothetical protein